MSEPKPDQPKFANFAKLTVRVGTEPEMRYSTAGQPWARARVSLSMGKTSDGHFKPALWLTAKAFAREGDPALPNALNDLHKGDLVTLSGRLMYEEYATATGQKRTDLALVINKLEVISATAPAPEAGFDPPTA